MQTLNVTGRCCKVQAMCVEVGLKPGGVMGPNGMRKPAGHGSVCWQTAGLKAGLLCAGPCAGSTAWPTWTWSPTGTWPRFRGTSSGSWELRTTRQGSRYWRTTAASTQPLSVEQQHTDTIIHILYIILSHPILLFCTNVCPQNTTSSRPTHLYVKKRHFLIVDEAL